jgi:uncharacterized protein YqgV (UPF0045/DUF77 family)
MNMTIDISMYPLRDEYLAPIDKFIAKLHEYSSLRVTTNSTATKVCGEYHDVMDALKDAIAWSYENFGTAVFVTKFIPGYDPL